VERASCPFMVKICQSIICDSEDYNNILQTYASSAISLFTTFRSPPFFPIETLMGADFKQKMAALQLLDRFEYEDATNHQHDRYLLGY